MASLIIGNGLDPVAFNSTLRIAKAIGKQGAGEDETIADAIWWCADPNFNGDYKTQTDKAEKGGCPQRFRLMTWAHFMRN